MRFVSLAIGATLSLSGLSIAQAHTSHATERYPYYSTSVSCEKIRADLKEAKALIIYSAPHLYDRYVAYDGYCYSGDEGRRAYIPTQDQSHCPVMKCVPHSR